MRTSFSSNWVRVLQKLAYQCPLPAHLGTRGALEKGWACKAGHGTETLEDASCPPHGESSTPVLALLAKALHLLSHLTSASAVSCRELWQTLGGVLCPRDFGTVCHAGWHQLAQPALLDWLLRVEGGSFKVEYGELGFPVPKQGGFFFLAVQEDLPTRGSTWDAQLALPACLLGSSHS